MKKSYYELYALIRLEKFLTLEKSKISACSITESQFPIVRWFRCFVQKQICKVLRKGTI